LVPPVSKLLCSRAGFEKLVMFRLRNHQLRAVSEKFLPH